MSEYKGGPWLRGHKSITVFEIIQTPALKQVTIQSHEINVQGGVSYVTTKPC